MRKLGKCEEDWSLDKQLDELDEMHKKLFKKMDSIVVCGGVLSLIFNIVVAVLLYLMK